MSKIFTLFYRVKKMVGKNKQDEASVFINKALRNEFSPSEQTLKNIKAFADAYYYAKSESVGDLENSLN